MQILVNKYSVIVFFLNFNTTISGITDIERNFQTIKEQVPWRRNMTTDNAFKILKIVNLRKVENRLGIPQARNVGAETINREIIDTISNFDSVIL